MAVGTQQVGCKSDLLPPESASSQSSPFPTYLPQELSRAPIFSAFQDLGFAVCQYCVHGGLFTSEMY
jgi:hypothetical protein